MEPTSINDLPFEIFVNILKYLNGTTVGKCIRVCKQWNEYIHESDNVWHLMCRKEFKYSSVIARERASSDCRWYHIYRNLKLWSKLMNYEKYIKEFYSFPLQDLNHMLNVDKGILPLRDERGIALYDLSTMKYIPTGFTEKRCYKIVHNDFVTIVETSAGLLLQRSVESPNYSSEEFIKADGFVLGPKALYFHKDQNVYKVDLTQKEIIPILMFHGNYRIMEIAHDKGVLHLFTSCGRIVTIRKDFSTYIKFLYCPYEWFRQMRHVKAVSDRIFVCYSRKLFKIETDQYEHLYLEFPMITALFFYVDVVLIGTANGEILLYRLASQKKSKSPIFETLYQFPEGRFATRIEVHERPRGPQIIISTLFELYILEIILHPYVRGKKKTLTEEKALLYERLYRLKDRLKTLMPNTRR